MCVWCLNYWRKGKALYRVYMNYCAENDSLSLHGLTTFCRVDILLLFHQLAYWKSEDFNLPVCFSTACGFTKFISSFDKPRWMSCAEMRYNVHTFPGSQLVLLNVFHRLLIKSANEKTYFGYHIELISRKHDWGWYYWVSTVSMFTGFHETAYFTLQCDFISLTHSLSQPWWPGLWLFHCYF